MNIQVICFLVCLVAMLFYGIIPSIYRELKDRWRKHREHKQWLRENPEFDVSFYDEWEGLIGLSMFAGYLVAPLITLKICAAYFLFKVIGKICS